MYAELSRIDAGLATFAVVQSGLLTSTIEQLGTLATCCVKFYFLFLELGNES